MLPLQETLKHPGEYEVAKIVVDGKSYTVNPDHNLLQECLTQGLDLPYFCWHPCMGSVGACRQCAVKQYRNEEDETGTIVMACMTPASDGSIISINDEQAAKFRSNVIESLMISHPHDCPVCEEGGECHLQDMTLMSGHNYRRYDKRKVTHKNQYLGPFIGHEMNRCITCYRCVRYYDEYAGGTDLSAQACHHHTYFGRQADGVLESEFSGNLVEVCPTGVFTDATFSEHYTRKWDLQCAPSVCTGCAVGCNITPGEREGTLRRIVNRYHGQINTYFLCDRGRFGYGFVNSPQRLTVSRTQSALQQQSVTAEGAALTEDEVRERIQALSKTNIIGIGSPRASNEANYALMNLVGEENFYSGASDTEFELINNVIDLLADPQFHCPSVREIEQADAVLIIGEDVTNTAPRIALALRQSVRNEAAEIAAQARIPAWQDAAVRELAQQARSPLTIMAGYATRLDDIACRVHIDTVKGLIDTARAIAGELDPTLALPEADTSETAQSLAKKVAAELLAAKRPLVVCGSSTASVTLLQSAANVARALAAARPGNAAIDLCCLTTEVNALGMGMICDRSRTLGQVLTRLESGEVENAIVLENDLYRRAPAAQLDAALAKVKQLVVLDQLETPLSKRADMVVATTSFPEQEGTFVNYEGRAQLSMQVYQSQYACRPAWDWLTQDQNRSFNAVIQACDQFRDDFRGIAGLLPDPQGFVGGMKVPRQSHRYSGRTALISHLNVHEPKQPQDQDSVMAFSMEGVSNLHNSSVLASSWAPQWNSNQSVSKFQDEIGGELRQGNPGVRLISKGPDGDYFPMAATPSALNQNELLAFPAYQIFGSDELSNYAEPVQQRLCGSYVALSAEDASRLGITQSSLVNVRMGELDFDVSACIRKNSKPGTAAIFTEGARFLEFSDSTPVLIQPVDGQADNRLNNLIVSDLVMGDD